MQDFFSSLDHITKGRIAWNIVTSVTDAEAQNFSLKKQIPHEIRYDRAHEALQVVTGLWNSWDEDAFDKSLTREIFFDPPKARFLNHSGKYFSVRGPLNIHRSPQNFPVLVQAGSSEMGRNFAARWSEIIFTAQMDLASAIEFGKDIRIRCSAFNRDPLPLIMPGVVCIFGETEACAKRMLDELQSKIPIEVSKAQLKSQLGDVHIDFSNLDQPIGKVPSTEGCKSRQTDLLAYAEKYKLTLSELMARVTLGRGHLVLVGTGESVANQLAQWFESGAADGFNLMPPYMPGGLSDFIDFVLPHLRSMNLVQLKYGQRTLREKLRKGLS